MGLSAPIGATIATGSVTTTIHDDGTGFVPPGVTPGRRPSGGSQRQQPDGDRRGTAGLHGQPDPSEHHADCGHTEPGQRHGHLGTDTDPAQVSFEPNETMTLGAATAQNASPVSGTGTINDNDGAPQLSISGPADVNEAAGTISYTVSLTNASASPVTVNTPRPTAPPRRGPTTPPARAPDLCPG
ncbi:MAG: hypothetical protein IPI02_21780 [Sterolibacteriaceae bacterium]|nr:hypothetical protein [Sterolibacteriaceae bacterium]